MRKTGIAGRTALVTGGAVRIGRAIALALADEGAKVVVHYRSSATEATALVEELAGKGVEAYSIKADFQVPGEVDSLVERTIELAGGLELLVNSASIFPADRIVDLTFRSLMANMQVNAWAPLVLTRELARLSGKGAVVNLEDSRLSSHDPSHAGYILSKDALSVVTRMTALELAPDIRVNAVRPGLILPPPGEDDSYVERLVGTVPLKRRGHPEDVAAAVVFLLGSEFVTGEVVYVDGGRHLREKPSARTA